MALVLFLCVLAWGWRAAAQSNEPNAPTRLPREAKAAIIPCQGLIDQSLFYSIKRRTEIALHERGGLSHL